MNKFILAIVLFIALPVDSLYSQSRAIIVTVDGLSFKNTFNIINQFMGAVHDANEAYLKSALSELDLDIDKNDIVNFPWNRDAKNTVNLVTKLRKFLRQNYERALEEKKKFIVVSHSWGTVLSYLALSFESQVSVPLECDLFITLSSPLGTEFVPIQSDCIDATMISNQIQNFVSMFFKIMDFSNCVNCYPKAKNWYNYWAHGDLISGPVKYYSFINNVRVENENTNLCDARSKQSTDIWHRYTNLKKLKNPDNSDLREKIEKIIKETIGENEVRKTTKKIQFGFILDSSGSMAENDPNDSRKSAMKLIIDQFTGSENVFLVDFDNRASWINGNNWSNWDKQSLFSNIDKIDSRGGTDVGIGLATMQSALSQSLSSFANTGVILLSDGLGNYTDEADWFKMNNIPVFTISFKGDDNSRLLSDIAALTKGKYVKANNEYDILRAFKQFVNGISGNSTFARFQGVIKQNETRKLNFWLDPNSGFIFPTLSWRGSKIFLKLTSPDGTVYSEKSNQNKWAIGPNYSSVKINNPEGGKWEVELFGVRIPQGGEEFILDISGETGNKIDLIETGIVGRQIVFDLEDNVNLKNKKWEGNVLTPKNRKENIMSSINNDKITYSPRDGVGSYNFEVSLSGKDNTGNNLQRHFSNSVLIGDNIPANTAPVKSLLGEYLKVDLGENVGNYPGLICTIYRERGGNKVKIADGYVTVVRDFECDIEVTFYYLGSEIFVGDIVELNFAKWSRD